jgi:hypothetical protein
VRVNPPGHRNVDDQIRLIEAAGILAGKPIHSRDKITYERLIDRVRTAVRRGQVRAERLDGVTRYSRRDVEALKAALDAAGINGRAQPKSKHLASTAKQMDAAGFVNSATARALAGVSSPGLPARWGRMGLYGARKIAGQWFFDRSLLLGAHRRAARQPSLEVRCAACGESMMRTASEVRKGFTRGRGRFYHRHCWAEVRSGVLRENRLQAVARGLPKESADSRAKRSAAQRAAWASGKHDRQAHSQIARDMVTTLRNSPTRHAAQIEDMQRTRYGSSPTEGDVRRREKSARRRQQASTARAEQAAARRARVAELSATDKTLKEITAALQDEFFGVTLNTVKQDRRFLKLPARPRGRRPSAK